MLSFRINDARTKDHGILEMILLVLLLGAATCVFSVETASNKRDLTTAIRILSIRSNTNPYTGYGKVKISCTGTGDNTTTVHWTRKDKDGNNVTLSSTSLNLEHIPLWQAKLIERPDVTKLPYDYQCVVQTKCCGSKVSQPLRVTHITIPGCPFFGVYKPVQFNPVPKKRSAKLRWVYDADPEDTGFLLTIDDAIPPQKLGIHLREYVAHNLVPSTTYLYTLQILYGSSCKTIRIAHSFKTLPDTPSKPQNLTVRVKSNSINLSWLPPQFPNGEGLHYTVFWRRIFGYYGYKKANVTANSFTIESLDQFTSYKIKVQAVNQEGYGESTKTMIVATKGPIPRLYQRLILYLHCHFSENGMTASRIREQIPYLWKYTIKQVQQVIDTGKCNHQWSSEESQLIA